MLKRIVSISGKPGLYRLVNQGKNMLIVEALATGKRMPVYMHDKVMSLGDISIYTLEGDVPLAEVLENVKKESGGQPVDLKAMGTDANIREFFAQVLPQFDQDRVYTTDIKKLLSWYNILLNAGITEFVEPKQDGEKEQQEPADAEAESTEKA